MLIGKAVQKNIFKFITIMIETKLKTFFNFVVEQIEFHLWGGSGSAGVSSAVYSLGRSTGAFLLLLPIIFYACEVSNLSVRT